MMQGMIVFKVVKFEAALICFVDSFIEKTHAKGFSFVFSLSATVMVKTVSEKDQ